MICRKGKELFSDEESLCDGEGRNMSWLKTLFIRWPASIWGRLVALRASLISLLEDFVRSELGRPGYVLLFFAVIGMFLIAYGIESIPGVEKSFYTKYRFVKDYKFFFKELGVALVIGALMGFTVELYNRLRHEKDKKETEQKFLELARQITQDVSKKITREGIFALFPALSPKIIGATQEQVLNAPVTREKYKIFLDYELEEGFLTLTTTVRFKLRNASERAYSHPFSCQFEPDTADAISRDTTPIFLKLGSDVYDGIDAMKEAGLIEPAEGTIKKVSKVVQVPSEGVLDVVLKFSERKGLVDVTYWVMVIPCDKLTLTVAAFEGLVYSVDSLHPDGVDLEPDAESSLRRTWKIKGGLLPGQGILIKWRCNTQGDMLQGPVTSK